MSMQFKVEKVGKIADAVKKAGGKTLLKVHKNSPKIWLVLGLATGAAAVVSGIMAGRKVDEAIEKTHAELDDIREATDDALTKVTVKENALEIKKEAKKDSIKAYVKCGGEMAKIFGPTVALSVVSAVCLIKGHNIQNSRIAQVSAAYAGLDAAFKDYRKRIADIAGEEAEQRFFDGTDEVNVSVLDEETGKKKKEKVTARKVKKVNSPYEFDFNKATAPFDFTNNNDHNYMYLRSVQSICNDKFNAQGHLFLNEALDAIGMPRTREGAILGWVKGAGDDFIDFGFSDFYTDEISDIQVGGPKNIHLNMNCDGIIWDKI